MRWWIFGLVNNQAIEFPEQAHIIFCLLIVCQQLFKNAYWNVSFCTNLVLYWSFLEMTIWIKILIPFKFLSPIISPQSNSSVNNPSSGFFLKQKYPVSNYPLLKFCLICSSQRIFWWDTWWVLSFCFSSPLPIFPCVLLISFWEILGGFLAVVSLGRYSEAHPVP